MKLLLLLPLLLPFVGYTQQPDCLHSWDSLQVQLMADAECTGMKDTLSAQSRLFLNVYQPGGLVPSGPFTLYMRLSGTDEVLEYDLPGRQRMGVNFVGIGAQPGQTLELWLRDVQVEGKTVNPGEHFTFYLAE